MTDLTKSLAEMRAREWWIREALDYHDDGGVYDTQEMPYYIHVVDKTSYDRLLRACEVMASAIKTSIVVEHECEECGTFTSVRYEIKELKDALEEAAKILGD